MWISFAGSDSTKLVEELERQFAQCDPAIQIDHYKKSASNENKTVAADPAVNNPIDLEISAESEDYYLPPMANLQRLAISIAESPRVLVILSPNYVQSERCLQELAALICHPSRSQPLFVLNGITHEQMKKGKLIGTVPETPPTKSVDIVASLVSARDSLCNVNFFNTYDELDNTKAKSYLECLNDQLVIDVNSNVAIDANSDRSAMDSGGGETISRSIVDDAMSIVGGVISYYFNEVELSKYSESLQEADRKRYIGWFDNKFGKHLLDRLCANVAKINGEKNSADFVIRQLLANPVEMNQHISEALDGLVPRNELSDKEKDDWNNGISELTGLYALTLIDYDTFVKQGIFDTASPYLPFKFQSGKIHAHFQASVINATVRNAMLRIRPPADGKRSHAPDTPGFRFHEAQSIATEQGKEPARVFVEVLHAWVRHRSTDSCPENANEHPTKLNEEERADLRGLVLAYEEQHGDGSLVLVIEEQEFTAGTNWWDQWHYVHARLNDGAESEDSQVMLRGVVVTRHSGSATITMHPKYERRLTYLRNLLRDYYLT